MWLIHKWHAPFVFDMAHSFAIRQDLFVCDIHKTHSYVTSTRLIRMWHPQDSFVCDIWGMTDDIRNIFHMRHAWFTRDTTDLHVKCRFYLCRFYICAMAHIVGGRVSEVEQWTIYLLFVYVTYILFISHLHTWLMQCAGRVGKEEQAATAIESTSGSLHWTLSFALVWFACLFLSLSVTASASVCMRSFASLSLSLSLSDCVCVCMCAFV